MTLSNYYTKDCLKADQQIRMALISFIDSLKNILQRMINKRIKLSPRSAREVDKLVHFGNKIVGALRGSEKFTFEICDPPRKKGDLTRAIYCAEQLIELRGKEEGYHFRRGDAITHILGSPIIVIEYTEGKRKSLDHAITQVQSTYGMYNTLVSRKLLDEWIKTCAVFESKGEVHPSAGGLEDYSKYGGLGIIVLTHFNEHYKEKYQTYGGFLVEKEGKRYSLKRKPYIMLTSLNMARSKMRRYEEIIKEYNSLVVKIYRKPKIRKLTEFVELRTKT